MTLGWGMIGVGRSADTLLAPSIAADPNSRLVHVVSRDSDRAQAFADRHGAEAAGADVDAMLANPAVDVVAVASPNALHPEHVLAAARAGKDVLCDKPLAPNATAGRRMLDGCAAAGVRIGLNFQTRYHTCFLEARRVIEAGEIGRILAIQVDASPGAVPLVDWRADPARAGLGATNNIGTHILDLVRFLTGDEVTEVSAMLDAGQAEALETMAFVQMRFAGGALGFANFNQVTPMPLNDIVIHGTKGRIDGRGITRPRQEGEMRIVTPTGTRISRYSSDDCYVRLVTAFSTALLSSRDPDPSGLDGLRCVEITDAIRLSAREARLVELGA